MGLDTTGGLPTLTPPQLSPSELGNFFGGIGGGGGGWDPFGGKGDNWGCTVRGTALLTPEGPVSNEEIYRSWLSDEKPRLTGEGGMAEEIEHLEWVRVPFYYRATIEDYEQFGCSATHLFQTGLGQKTFAKDVPPRNRIWTREGWRELQLERVDEETEVLRVSTRGPSHVYWVGKGVWSHNVKPPLWLL